MDSYFDAQLQAQTFGALAVLGVVATVAAAWVLDTVRAVIRGRR
jgi:hypothetical protein